MPVAIGTGARPANGRNPDDISFYAVRVTFSGSNALIANASSGSDTSLIYDDDVSIGAVSASSIILIGVITSQLSIIAGTWFIGVI